MDEYPERLKRETLARWDLASAGYKGVLGHKFDHNTAAGIRRRLEKCDDPKFWVAWAYSDLNTIAKAIDKTYPPNERLLVHEERA